MERRLTPKQRLALQMIRDGDTAAADIPTVVGVQGGFGNEAEFLYRLIDRGLVTLTLTPEGRAHFAYEDEEKS
jgi:hypothetical protein